MKWESDFGLCYPGWHIECSAMGRKYLGDVFDIHTGGIDLVPTHHENEIAQSKGATGKMPANFWMHCEFLLVDGGKMSKSLGNTYLVDDIIEKGYSPLAYKLMCFSSHYRNKLNFTWESLESNHNSLLRIKEGYQKHLVGTDEIEKSVIDDYKERFLLAINDDMNMPVAISVVWEIVRNSEKSKDLANLLLNFDKVLGLDIEIPIKTKEIEELPKEILELLDKRAKAREEKNWGLSDEIRDSLKEKGYEVKDTKEGQKLEKI